MLRPGSNEPVGNEPTHTADVTVVRLGALCQLESEAERQANFRISEFAVLDDGTEITLHNERGLSIFLNVAQPSGVWPTLTMGSLEASVRTVVLPDDAEETGQDHPWTWLHELLAAQGVDTTVEHLKALPYEVRLGDDVTSRMQRDS